MKSYEKPVVSAVEAGVSEDVYMASGVSSSDCWQVGATSVQELNGSHHVFEMSAVHSDSVVHITTQVQYVYTFNNTITDAYSEGYVTTFSGNTVTVVRDNHANGYTSGDDVTFKVWVKSTDEAATRALACTGQSYTCRHETNVQGGID